MTNLGTKLEEYWNEMCFRRKRENPNATTPVEDTMLVHPVFYSLIRLTTSTSDML